MSLIEYSKINLKHILILSFILIVILAFIICFLVYSDNQSVLAVFILGFAFILLLIISLYISNSRLLDFIQNDKINYFLKNKFETSQTNLKTVKYIIDGTYKGNSFKIDFGIVNRYEFTTIVKLKCFVDELMNDEKTRNNFERKYDHLFIIENDGIAYIHNTINKKDIINFESICSQLIDISIENNLKYFKEKE